MRIRGVLLAVAMLLSTLAPASATMRISNDRGGQIGHYLETFALLRSSGERVVIDGNCLSACTLLLGIIPREQMCATSRARLGFHAAWMPDPDGRPVTSNLGTRALWSVYPSSVRHWITRHGGLSRRMIYLQGRELYAFVPSCETIEARANTRSAERDRRRERLGYANASAASDSH
jgi:hypothetical protein